MKRGYYMKKINVCLTLKCVVAFMLVISLCGCQKLDYNRADKFYNEKNYTEAIKLYKSLGDYRDSKDKILTASYDSLYSHIKNNDNNIKISENSTLYTESNKVILNAKEKDPESDLKIYLYPDNNVICEYHCQFIIDGEVKSWYSCKIELDKSIYKKESPVELKDYSYSGIGLAGAGEYIKNDLQEYINKELNYLSQFLNESSLEITLKDLGFLVY